MPRLTELTAKLEATIDAVCEADPLLLADGEAIQVLHRQLERLEAATTRAAATFDAGRAWEADGARSAASWISTRCHLPASSCRRRVHLGRHLRHLPTVEAAWLAGEVNGAHVGMLTAARTPATAESFVRDELMLVDLAQRLRFPQFQKALAYWLHMADPDGVEDRADAQHDARRLHLSQSGDGMWFLDGCFDPISGAVLERALKHLEQELFEGDWAEGKSRLGDRVSANDLARTPAQRRADAAVEMARRAGRSPRRPPAGAAVQRVRRVRDLRRADLRVG